MGAAIAYNTLFALVPLAIAFTAILALLDRSDTADAIVDWLTATFPESVAGFLAEIVQQSVDAIAGRQGIVLVVALGIALWSGSRAVHAVQKALRTMQGVEDRRGYLTTRGFGVLVTLGASVGVFAIYTVFTVGFQSVAAVEGDAGELLGRVETLSLSVGLIVWSWLLVWAIYRWGPPIPIRRSSLVAAATTAVLTVGSFAAVRLLPTIGSPVAVFGSLGVFLVWLYMVGIVVVAMPTVVYGLAAGLREIDAG